MAAPLSARFAGAAVLAAFPWLNPMAIGPSPAVLPWLASAACALALWVLAYGRGGGAVAPRGLVWAAGLLSAAALLPHLPVRPEAVMLAGGVVLIVLAAGIAREHGLARALQAGLLAAAAFNAVFGLVQYFGASETVPFINSAEIGEAFGNLRQRNQFATLCWIGAAVVLFGTLRLPRAAAFPLMILFGVGGAASASRTGVLEAIVVLALAAWWPGEQRRGRLWLCAAASTAYVIAAVLLPPLLELATGAVPAHTLLARFGPGAECHSRLVLWSNVLRLIALKPLAGWGWGELDYAHYMTLYPGARFCEILDNAHSLPLHLAVELGVPAALLACGGALLWAWRQRPWSEDVLLRQLAWALLALILLHSLLEYPLWYGPFQLAAGFALGWLLPADTQLAVRPARWRATAAALLLACSGYAAWDYARVSQIYIPPEERWLFWRDDTLARVRGSWLFGGQARFAEFTLATPTRGNAQRMTALGEEVLHYSPEPRVIEQLVESAVLAGREDEAVLHLARFRAAFPADYAAWRERQRKPLPVTP